MARGSSPLKPRPKSTLYCVGLLCLTAWYLCCSSGPTWYTSHFYGFYIVLKVSLNNKQTNNIVARCHKKWLNQAVCPAFYPWFERYVLLTVATLSVLWFCVLYLSYTQAIDWKELSEMTNHVLMGTLNSLTLSVFLPPHFNGHFSSWTWVSRFYWSYGWWRWWVVTTGAIKTCKAPVKSSPTKQHPAL